ncbi:MAG: tripartite tricarboxylate transporter TctB family protein [Rhodospirillales bacterium]
MGVAYGMTRKPAWPESAVGAAVLALSAVVLWETAAAPASPSYAQVGPAAFPYGVGAGLVLIGALLVAAGLRGGWRDPKTEAENGPPRLRPFLWVALGLLVNAALIPYLGFILSSIALFLCIARGFGSRRVARDLVWGASLSFAAYLGFAKLLAIRLGDGLIERFL